MLNGSNQVALTNLSQARNLGNLSGKATYSQQGAVNSGTNDVV